MNRKKYKRKRFYFSLERKRYWSRFRVLRLGINSYHVYAQVGCISGIFGRYIGNSWLGGEVKARTLAECRQKLEALITRQLTDALLGAKEKQHETG